MEQQILAADEEVEAALGREDSEGSAPPVSVTAEASSSRQRPEDTQKPGTWETVGRRDLVRGRPAICFENRMSRSETLKSFR